MKRIWDLGSGMETKKRRKRRGSNLRCHLGANVEVIHCPPPTTLHHISLNFILLRLLSVEAVGRVIY